MSPVANVRFPPIADVSFAADNAQMQKVRLAVTVLLLPALAYCGEQPVSRNKLPEGVTAEMVDHYRRVRAHRKPPAGLIDAVEAQVANERCVGNLSRWERLYSFGLDDKREVDETKILFGYRQAGVYGFQSGKRATSPAAWVMLDDRDYDLVSGSFDRTSGHLVIESCGPNLPRRT